MTVFIVWYSMPGLVGSSRRRIAEWAPYADGVTSTSKETSTFFGRAIEVALENVPSLPCQLTL
jgi:hypothetical protein